MKNNFSKYSDAELVNSFRKEKEIAEGAFTEIYHRYSSTVHSYCFRVMNNIELAEDIFQETFIRFFQNVKSDFSQTNIPGYLIRIARNLCLNHKRTKREFIPVEEAEFLVEREENYEKKELLDLITVALDLLDIEYRECFVLREYDGLSYEEISDICNITVPNAKSRVFRAKQKLKEILQPYMKDLCK